MFLMLSVNIFHVCELVIYICKYILDFILNHQIVETEISMRPQNFKLLRPRLVEFEQRFQAKTFLEES